MTNQFRTERLDVRTIKDLRALYRSVYQKDCGASYFPMKYDTAYTGTQYIGYIAYQGNIPVAYYGVVPTIMSMQNKPALAAQSCDTMTHPSFRKQGWFVKLAHLTFTLAKQEGIHFIFGFPNQNSYPGFIKYLGFTHQGTMNRFSFTFPSSLYHQLYFRTWKTLAAKYAGTFENPLLREGFDGMPYSLEFHQYRQYSKTQVFTSHQGKALLKSAHGLWIGAVNLDPRKNMQQLINEVAKRSKTPAITMMASPGTAFNAQLEAISQPHKAFAVITKNLSNIYKLDKLKFQLSDIDIF